MWSFALQVFFCCFTSKLGQSTMTGGQPGPVRRMMWQGKGLKAPKAAHSGASWRRTTQSIWIGWWIPWPCPTIGPWAPSCGGPRLDWPPPVEGLSHTAAEWVPHCGPLGMAVTQWAPKLGPHGAKKQWTRGVQKGKRGKIRVTSHRLMGEMVENPPLMARPFPLRMSC